MNDGEIFVYPYKKNGEHTGRSWYSYEDYFWNIACKINWPGFLEAHRIRWITNNKIILPGFC